ncbi:putative ricin b lectin [Colletotrichum musicola]|uniref:Putative ricin b lectin n=1 Tax=Colletotrichum musicola TaxID=2175873 RepID=A0A8H6JLJ5_9PEZI|nr:putative ricin b lectin [Colletotrichum musicola]
MKLSLIAAVAACAAAAEGAITYTIQRATNPTADQTDAYNKIDAAMKLAVARHSRLGSATKNLRVYYAPGVPTAEASYNGDVRFGSNRSYMNERTALHEISHTLGIGQTAAFDRKCAAKDWATALPLLRSWDGSAAVINCGGSHIWPYGLNYDNEWSETNANRHVQLINAMIKDGM